MKETINMELRALDKFIYKNQLSDDGFYEAGPDCFMLTMVGDSMDRANIPSGSVVMVDRKVQVKDGEVGVVFVGGAFAVKRVYDKHTHIVLAPASSNPVYQPQIYRQKEHVKILGKVIFSLTHVG